MNAPPIPSPPAEFTDRRTGLMVFGVLQILLGCLIAAMIPLMIFGQVMSARITGQPPQLRQMVPGVLFYGILAFVLFALGIGSCKARRWARALTLVVSWSWLAVGVLSILSMIFLAPRFLQGLQAQGQGMPPQALAVMLAVMFIFMSIFLLLVPGSLVFFYQSRHVKATCEARHPEPSWTDACPLPVLALSLWFGMGALTFLTMPWSANGVLPAFGVLLSGLSGTFLCGLLAALFGWTAWALYRVKKAAWWIVLATVCLGTTSTVLTFLRVDWMEMYRLMGFPEQQIQMMNTFNFLQGSAIAYLSLGFAVPMLAYVVFVKRYFRDSPTPSTPS